MQDRPQPTARPESVIRRLNSMTLRLQQQFGGLMEPAAFLIAMNLYLIAHTEPDEPQAMAGECVKPPEGWRCTRPAGHEGACAAVAVRPEGSGTRRP